MKSARQDTCVVTAPVFQLCLFLMCLPCNCTVSQGIWDINGS